MDITNIASKMMSLYAKTCNMVEGLEDDEEEELLTANPTVVPIFEVDVEKLLQKEDGSSNQSSGVVPGQLVQGSKIIQMMDISVQQLQSKQSNKDDKGARQLLAEEIYDKRLGKSTRVKEDEVKEVNLGIEAHPQMVRVSVQVQGEFLNALMQLLQEYKDVFA